MCFKRVVGRDDIEGIEEYLKTYPGFDTVCIVCKEPLSGVVKLLIEEEDTERMLPVELLKKLRAKKNFSSTVSGEEISGTPAAEVCSVLKSGSLAQGINPKIPTLYA